MGLNQYYEALGKPFPYSDVRWRMQYVDKKSMEGYAVPYLDARAVENRLDEVIGQNNWKDSYAQWHTFTEKSEDYGKTIEKEVVSQLCTIYVYDDERKEWVGKTDGAENTDIESVKGGLSDSFKRAAVKWNVGRYMYKMEPVWVKVKQKGKSYVVDDKDKSNLQKLEDEYNKVVAEVFGTTTLNPGNDKSGNEKNTASEPIIYEIKKIRVEGEGKNARSTLILSNNGSNGTVYLYGSDPKLKVGAKITNIKSKKVKNSIGEYSIIEKYSIAA